MLILPKGGARPDTFMKHATAHHWLHDKSRKVMEEYPICPKCESIALRHFGWHKTKHSKCPKCGHEFDATTFLRGYLNEQLYR